MNVKKSFADTNVIVYLISSDKVKSARAEKILEQKPRISVQVLNEFTNVARKKLKLSWDKISLIMERLDILCKIEPLTKETNEKARYIAEKYNLSFYDSVIVSSALLSGCEILYSEDMHSGMKIEKTLKIVNPFEE